MLVKKKGIIFNTKAPAIVNPVNCVGVMGAGLALDFKMRSTSNYDKYREACDRRMLLPGGIFPYKTAKGLTILNAATKGHYKDKTQIPWVVEILTKLKRLDYVAIPYLGAGLGGLTEGTVEHFIREIFDNDLTSKIELWEYDPNDYDPLLTVFLQAYSEAKRKDKIPLFMKALNADDSLIEFAESPIGPFNEYLTKYPKIYTLSNI